MSFLPKILPRSPQQRQADFERALIRREAEIGAKLFGPVPKGHKRSFFCLDEYTWIWYEEWVVKGRRQAVTTRYEVRPDGVIKSQDGAPSRQLLSAHEARHLYRAVELYRDRVNAEYQRLLQSR